MHFLPLQKSTDLESAVAASYESPVLLFKHSATCSISIRANHQMLHLNEEGDPTIYQLIVQRARNLSHEIAEHFQVQHESPQVLLLSEGNVIFHTSHGAVTAERIRQEMSAITPEKV